MKDYQLQLARLFEEWAGVRADDMQTLVPAASDRRYFRLRANNVSAVGVFNADLQENKAFLAYSKHFKSLDLAVPDIYAESADKGIYLQQDLGDTMLYQLLPAPGQNWLPDTELLLRKSIEMLAQIQLLGGKNLDYSNAYPRAAFDAQSMRWDLHYCKHYFLKLSRLPFNEQALEDSFDALIAHLLEADTQHFLYRDFQSRNVMIHDNRPWAIDYQGGRKGAPQYDVASMLYQSRAGFTSVQRQLLLDRYLQYAVNIDAQFDVSKFQKYWDGYVLVRMLQTLGAYGFRGLFERKPLFMSSLEAAVAQLEAFLPNADLPNGMLELRRLLNSIFASGMFKPSLPSEKNASLTVTIQSFSYIKRGYPTDVNGNGGGFAFDCRFIDNPGRIDIFKPQTGLDLPVQQFLERETNMSAFLEQVWAITDSAVADYLQRGRSNLQVNFGCTGGQHRSVYAAERTAAHLRKKFGVQVQLTHLERDNWPKH